MAASFAQMLYSERQAGNVRVDIRGFAMGNAWIHPVDSTLSWAPFLFANVIYKVIYSLPREAVIKHLLFPQCLGCFDEVAMF